MSQADDNKLSNTPSVLPFKKTEKFPPEKPSARGMCIEMREVLEKFFSKNLYLSPVAFAFKIFLQEKRIFELLDKANEKPPTLTEMIAILTAVYEGKSVSELAKELPGAIGEYLRQEYDYIMGTSHYTVSGDLLDLFKHKQNYIIYKLAANRSGVDFKEIQRLFGVSGVENAKYMLRREILSLEGTVLRAKTQRFILPNDLFTSAFKYVADYISTDADKTHQNVFMNLSESVNSETYDQILEIQRKALRQIFAILQDQGSVGDIPLFVLSAVDILE